MLTRIVVYVCISVSADSELVSGEPQNASWIQLDTPEGLLGTSFFQFVPQLPVESERFSENLQPWQ